VDADAQARHWPITQAKNWCNDNDNNTPPWGRNCRGGGRACSSLQNLLFIQWHLIGDVSENPPSTADTWRERL